MLQKWNTRKTVSSPAATYVNVLWSRLVQNLFAERETPLPVGAEPRLFTVVSTLLDDPADPLWANERIGVENRKQMLALSAEQAYEELSSRQETRISHWNWGGLHAIALTSETLGCSGIAPVEALFNRVPFPVG